MRALAPSTIAPSSSPSSLPSSPFNSSHSIDNKARCQGLDLLVQAVIHVAGWVVFAPKNAPMKEKRDFQFKNDKIQNESNEKKVVSKKEGERIDVISNPKRLKRSLTLPSKYKDSVLQPWKRRTRRRRD
ncbi:hypothetical protein ACLOJK_027100 [Asimina triloba]